MVELVDYHPAFPSEFLDRNNQYQSVDAKLTKKIEGQDLPLEGHKCCVQQCCQKN